MAVENLALSAVDRGLGTHAKTGAVMGATAARAVVTVPEDQCIVAFVNLGEPADLPPAKARRPAPEHPTRVPGPPGAEPRRRRSA